MFERIISARLIDDFKQYLYEEEKSTATIEKYLRDVRKFASYAKGTPVYKTVTLSYKEELSKEYAAASANSMIAALNAFLRFAGWSDACVKQLKIQKQPYCSEDKELTRNEYEHLVFAARSRGNERLAMMLQTICGTGIRVSELEFITVESVEKGEVRVNCKGKQRVIFIVPKLKKKLSRYAAKRGISHGPVFVTRTGKPMSRCNIWREMKSLCKETGISPSKVFPHNLRHLFARIFYSIERDIAKLADILGHSSIDTTRIYITTTGEEHRKRMEMMHLIL